MRYPDKYKVCQDNAYFISRNVSSLKTIKSLIPNYV